MEARVPLEELEGHVEALVDQLLEVQKDVVLEVVVIVMEAFLLLQVLQEFQIILL